MTDATAADEGIDLDEAPLTREVSKSLIIDILNERKAERRWSFVRRTIFALSLSAAMATWIGFMAGWWGYRMVPLNPSVAVVPIEGPIAKNTVGSADAIIGVLGKLFAEEKVRGILLQIDSGGGSPTEAERIAKFIDMRQATTGKPVIAVCETMCASAAYMIAIHADEVYVGDYSWAGSIGAILKAWDLKEVAQRFHVGQRVFASGEFKDLLNPFQEMPEAVAAKMEGLVNRSAEQFYRDVSTYREGHLDTSTNLFTGEIWTSHESVALGLVDGIGTLEEVLELKFTGLPYATYRPKRKENGFLNSVLSEFGSAAGSALADALLDAGKTTPQMEL